MFVFKKQIINLDKKKEIDEFYLLSFFSLNFIIIKEYTHLNFNYYYFNNNYNYFYGLISLMKNIRYLVYDVEIVYK
jgi:hypothetical protein